RIVSPTAMRRAAAAISTARKHYSLYGMEAAMTARALDTAVAKFAAAQTVVDLARIACALERYRLAHGVYPESLDALAPQFIEKMPRDIINGQPLHYRRTGNGKFVLYSVGWDGKDDGGHASGVSYDKGDWVWQN
ncbi:MAG: type II secretion system protein GspG, partial [Verrucomicrobia bacterium]|nr:type II secretion system protein GspG [Verrucomicrobiota bacterium]